EKLNSLGNCVDKFVLLVVVLIEKKMKLIERVAGDLPVVLFVEIAKGNGVCQDLIEILDACGANTFVKRNRELCNLAECLNFPGMLMENGAGALSACLRTAG